MPLGLRKLFWMSSGVFEIRSD